MIRSCRTALLITVSFLGCSNLVVAQETGVLAGRVVDAKNRTAIPFATVRLRNRMMGVISNADGAFQIPANLRLWADTLEVSCIGYITTLVPVEQLSRNDINVIALAVAEVKLPGVTVKAKRLKPLSPYEIVELAIANIPRNFSQRPFSYVAYYRDYQLKDSSYLNLNEAIIRVFDQGFQTNNQLETRMKLYEYKKNIDFPRDSATEVPYDNKTNKFIPDATLSSLGGNELSILQLHDPVRNSRVFSYSFVNTFAEDFINNHLFTRQPDVYLDKVPLYQIAFKARLEVSGSNHHARGTIYVQKDNFAIHKIDYRGYEMTVKESNLLYDIQLEYARIDSLMHLNYISFNNFFKVRNKEDFRVVGVVLDRTLNAFVVTFNNEPDPLSVQDKRNFEFKLNDVKLDVTEVRSRDAREVAVYLAAQEASKFYGKASVLSAQLKSDIKNIKDVHGRKLDKVSYVTVHQFRELFVQKIGPEPAGTENLNFVQKDKPLAENTLSPAADNAGYWMNTPLRKK